MVKIVKAVVVIFVLLIAVFLIKDSYTIYKKNKGLRGNIFVGTGNPGKIIRYYWDNSSVVSKSFDTGYKYAYTVRAGDIDNNGEIELVAGMSNSFFSEPYGCVVKEYKINGDSWKESTLDNVGDLRCKDLSIGDADNDGKNEVLLGTHGEGFINVYKKSKGVWNKTVLEQNFIAEIDEKNNTSHRVDRKNITYDAIVQSAVHIVKIGDIDNDGLNEVVATISSPLEFLEDEISFIKMYKFNKKLGRWEDSVIDELHGREFRSIAIGDIDGARKNKLVIGIGTPGKNPGSVYIYSFEDEKWDKTLLHDDTIERNMKGLTIEDINNDGSKEIVLATGFPNGVINIFKKDGNEDNFNNGIIGNIASLFNLERAEFNSMAVEVFDINGDKKKEIVVAGTTTYPERKIGWEGADSGFLVVFKEKGGGWDKEILETQNFLALDIVK